MTPFQIHICATLFKHNKPIDIFPGILSTQDYAYLFKAFQQIDSDLYDCYIIATQPTTILDQIMASNPSFDSTQLEQYKLIIKGHLCYK